MSSGRRELLQWLERTACQDAQFAARLGISPAYLSQILHGHRRPGLDVLARMRDLTGIPPMAWADTDEDEKDSSADRRRKKSTEGGANQGVSAALTRCRRS